MATVKEYIYKGNKIKIEVYESGKFHGYALGCLSSGAYDTMKECTDTIEKLVDEFLVNTPKTYKELAEVLTTHLTWTGYEECELDPKVCEIIVGNFIKINCKKFAH